MSKSKLLRVEGQDAVSGDRSSMGRKSLGVILSDIPGKTRINAASKHGKIGGRPRIRGRQC